MLISVVFMLHTSKPSEMLSVLIIIFIMIIIGILIKCIRMKICYMFSYSRDVLCMYIVGKCVGGLCANIVTMVAITASEQYIQHIYNIHIYLCNPPTPPSKLLWWHI